MNTITTNEIRELIKNNNEGYVLLDIRESDELEFGMIPTAKHIPLNELNNAFNLSKDEFQDKFNFPKPDKEIKIIVYCRSGARAEIAYNFLVGLKYNAILYQGSIQEYSKIDSNVRMY